MHLGSSFGPKNLGNSREFEVSNDPFSVSLRKIKGTKRAFSVNFIVAGFQRNQSTVPVSYISTYITELGIWGKTETNKQLVSLVGNRESNSPNTLSLIQLLIS